MRPAALNLSLYRGDSYAYRFFLWQDADKSIPVDLTGVTAKAEIRGSSGSTPILAMPCTVTSPNQIDMKLNASQWAAFTVRNGRWDLQLTYSTGEVVTVLAGTATVTLDITDSVPVS